MTYILAKSILYGTLSITVNDKKKEPSYVGLPIFLSGQFVYNEIKDVKVIDNQEYIFPLMWQVLFDSLYYKEATPVFLDFLMAFGALYAGKKIDEILT